MFRTAKCIIKVARKGMLKIRVKVKSLSCPYLLRPQDPKGCGDPEGHSQGAPPIAGRGSEEPWSGSLWGV